MWARRNYPAKLCFVVVRDEKATLTSLLEMELKYFFHQQHSLENIEVLGLPSHPEYTLRDLMRHCKSALMVDELILPGGLTDEDMKKTHEQWTTNLKWIQNKLTNLNGAFYEGPPCPLWMLSSLNVCNTPEFTAELEPGACTNELFD